MLLFLPILFCTETYLFPLQNLTEVCCLLKNHQLGSLVGLCQLGDADLEAVEGALEVDPALPLHGVVKVADVLRLLILLAILQRFFQNTFFGLLKKTFMNFFQLLNLAYR